MPNSLPPASIATIPSLNKALSIALSPLRGVPVGNESQTPGGGVWNGTTGTNMVPGHNTRKQYIAVRASGFVRIVYGHYLYSTGDTVAAQAGLQPVVVKATVEATSGAYLPVTFSGNKEGIVPPGGWLVSDPVACSIAQGQQFWVNSYAASPTQSWVYPNKTNSSWGESSDATGYNVASADKSSASKTANSLSGYFPFAVVGDYGFGLPYVAFIGDSIATGEDDTTAIVSAGRGFIRRALNNTIPYIALSFSGDAPTSTNFIYRLRALYGCTDIIVEEGINSIDAGTSLAGLQSLLIGLWSQCKAVGGARIWQTTMLPVTSSTDTWATAANQTPAASESVRTGFNSWLRARAPVASAANLTAVAVGTSGALLAGQAGHPLTGFFDPAALIEVNSAGTLTLNGGRWMPGQVSATDTVTLNSTTCALHPNSAGHAAIAPAITTSSFTG